ncbi:MAG: hypothetical protein M1602_06110, partial [Firmicutes bacterium]|nr:hypothetical protein [Bacillota bacterium]
KRVGIDSLTALLTKFLAVFIGLMSKDLPLTFLRDAWPEVEIGNVEVANQKQAAGRGRPRRRNRGIPGLHRTPHVTVNMCYR